MKFLLDENVHIGLFSFLYKTGHDVKLCPKSTPDESIFNLALEEKRTIISRDADFVEQNIKFPNHFGIILIRIRPKEIEKQKLALSNLLTRYSDIKGKCIKLLSENEVELL